MKVIEITVTPDVNRAITDPTHFVVAPLVTFAPIDLFEPGGEPVDTFRSADQRLPRQSPGGGQN